MTLSTRRACIGVSSESPTRGASDVIISSSSAGSRTCASVALNAIGRSAARGRNRQT